jgi:hypothetical protein
MRVVVVRSMAWLRSMTLFCEELHSFVLNEIPQDADASSYMSIPQELVQKRHLYPNLLSVCEDPSYTYMTGIPVPECKSEVELVQGLGAETYALINRHPAFNVFGNHKLFFEAGLNMCMALGTEHSWLDLAECRAMARKHLAS